MLINKIISLVWLTSAFVASLFIITSVAQAAEVSLFEATTLVANPSEQHTRTLAASCAACHGTNGNAVSGSVVGGNTIGSSVMLAGIDATYFTTQMLAFKNNSRIATVMHHHAKGLTADEINDLAVYFSQQERVTASLLKPQTLKPNHD